jgi:cation diffusion facilitator CzcD-associated flavoprotein CzcO
MADTSRQAPGASAGNGAARTLDALIIGAGVAGLYQLHQLRQLGLNARIYEAASDVGGT